MLQSASRSHLVLFLYYGMSHESWFMILEYMSVPDVSPHTGTEPISVHSLGYSVNTKNWTIPRLYQMEVLVRVIKTGTIN